jgi:molecular chaperone GrpE (heat shock protein)
MNLKAEIEAYRKDLIAKNGQIVSFSEAGPAGMKLIDALVDVIENLERRIAALEQHDHE